MEKIIGMAELVLVNPELVNDPAQNQGEVGIVKEIDLFEDMVTVSFGERPLGFYSVDALLVMKPTHELYRDLLVTGKDVLSKEAFKAVMRATMLLDGGKITDMIAALDTLKTVPAALNFATVSLDNKIDRIITGVDHTNDKTIGR